MALTKTDFMKTYKPTISTQIYSLQSASTEVLA